MIPVLLCYFFKYKCVNFHAFVKIYNSVANFNLSVSSVIAPELPFVLLIVGDLTGISQLRCLTQFTQPSVNNFHLMLTSAPFRLTNVAEVSAQCPSFSPPLAFCGPM